MLFIVYSCERKRVSVELVELWKIPDYGWPCMLLLVLKFVRKNTSHEKDCLQSRLFEVARHFRNDWFRKSWRAEPGVTRQITLSGFIPSAIFSVERICARGNRASRQRQARQPTRQPSQPPKASEAAHAQHCFRSRESWTFAPDRRSLLSSLASVRN